jgi:hypothetical protein
MLTSNCSEGPSLTYSGDVIEHFDDLVRGKLRAARKRGAQPSDTPCASRSSTLTGARLKP